MDQILAVFFIVGSNKIPTFFAIVTLGIIWIAFQVTKIKAKTKPAEVSRNNDWRNTLKDTNVLAYGLLLLTFIQVPVYLMREGWVKPISGILSFEEISFYLSVGIVLTFAGAITMFFFAKKIKQKYLNPQ